MPNASQREQIAESVYRELCEGYPGFPEELPGIWLARLGEASVRDIRLTLLSAMGRCALRAQRKGRPVEVISTDIECGSPERTRRMGFVA